MKNRVKIGEEDPDRHQNLVHCASNHAPPLQKISSKSVHNFLRSKLAEREFLEGRRRQDEDAGRDEAEDDRRRNEQV